MVKITSYTLKAYRWVSDFHLFISRITIPNIHEMCANLSFFHWQQCYISKYALALIDHFAKYLRSQCLCLSTALNVDFAIPTLTKVIWNYTGCMCPPLCTLCITLYNQYKDWCSLEVPAWCIPSFNNVPHNVFRIFYLARALMCHFIQFLQGLMQYGITGLTGHFLYLLTKLTFSVFSVGLVPVPLCLTYKCCAKWHMRSLKTGRHDYSEYCIKWHIR